MNDEIEFKKYLTRGAYHWEQISAHPTRSNASAKARYQRCVALLEAGTGSLVDKQVLDVGCGDGVLSWLLVQRGAVCHGVDPSQIAVEYARKKHKAKGSRAQFSVSSGYETKAAGGFYDAVVSSDVIEHVQDPNRLLQEILRVLKPGGTAVISTPVRLTEDPLDKMHVTEWFPCEFKAIISNVFPSAHYVYSHPMFWMEFMDRSKFHRAVINTLSLLWNPFFATGWRLYALQYAIVHKKQPTDQDPNDA